MKEITEKEGGSILLKNLTPILFAAISGLSAISPTWGILFATATGLINTWGEFGQSRVNELVGFINEHREEFLSEVIEGESFKTLFLNVLERHMKEASEEKRQYLRNYLLNTGKGINSDFNEFTRMNSTLDTITLEEIDFLKLWDEKEIVGSYIREQFNHPHAMTIADIQSCAYRPQIRDIALIKKLALEAPNQDHNNQVLMSLGYKGLLYALSQDNFGSGQEVRVKEITTFGKAFLAFIKAPGSDEQ